MCLSLVLCADPRQNIPAALLSISSVKGIGKVIPIPSTTYNSPMMSSVAFPTENISSILHCNRAHISVGLTNEW